jgi:Domain of unknown function (DUF1998)
MIDENPIRASQLISPFGVGAMLTTRYGVSVMTACLDYWFKREDGSRDSDIDDSEFRVNDWRLEDQLGVEYFLQPPDYRRASSTGERRNAELTIPTVRFPRWHWCSSCHNLYWRELHDRTKRIHCEACLKDSGSKKGRKRPLVQVPFVAICEAGHIEDFPFREWVHKSINPTCNGQLKLNATGGATLAAQKVSCSCGVAPRSLMGVQGDAGNSTVLSSQAEPGQQYLCHGCSPWKGKGRGRRENCGRELRGALRSASNVYFSKVKSSIYLPQESADVSAELLSLFDDYPINSLFKLFMEAGVTTLLQTLKAHPDCKKLLANFSDHEIQAAITAKGNQKGEVVREARHKDDDEETAFRRAEYAVLNGEHNLPDLIVKPNSIDSYSADMQRYFDKIVSVHRLRETRALYGFSRFKSYNGLDLRANKALLSKYHQKPGEKWLPAHIVHGEGIFLVFNETRIKKWLAVVANEMDARISNVAAIYAMMKAASGLANCILTPRFLLIHSFAHILINRLTFECGYSSASLRERLFVSDIRGAEMAGVLIYTAAGDSEGTMGGLVRMAKPELLEPCIEHAIDDARWCSNDPICLEAGRSGGQGPESCNLAACHSCCLLPETACEEFNRFLDRAMLVGDFGNAGLGYFNSD